MREVEEWRAIPGFEGSYEVSSHGRVRSLDRIVLHKDGNQRRCTGRVLRPNRDTRGYLRVALSSGRPVHRIHVLVLEAFVGPRPPGGSACHSDGNQLNNHVSNLRWDTQSENINDAVRHGTHFQTRKAVCLRGHLLVEPNLRAEVSANGHRGCLACQRGLRRVRRARAQGIELQPQAEADWYYQRIMQRLPLRESHYGLQPR